MTYATKSIILLLFGLTCDSQPNASCVTNGTVCPSPKWPPVYTLSQSTMVNPNGPSPFSPTQTQPWGLVSLDWNVASQVWNASGPHLARIEEVSRGGCRDIKKMFPQTRCFLYHNLELSLEAMESQRAAMYPNEPFYDPSFFLRFPNGTIYNEPGGPGDQFFWNFTNPSTRDFFVRSVMESISFPEVDGTYTDDVTGLPSEHYAMVKALNLSESDISKHQYATSQTGAALIEAAVAAGKYVWQAFDGDDRVGRDGSLPGPTPQTCLLWMRTRCQPEYLTHPVLQQAYQNGLPVPTPTLLNVSLASFLITRGPHAFWGFGWDGKPHDQVNWLPLFEYDIGEPLGTCTETGPGVFQRPWTYGNSVLDCNKFEGVVPARTS